MQHSHEALDRPGGFERARLLAPLRHRDFRILWSGMAVSLVGDGIFLIAVAWETYVLWNAPAALSIVGIAMTVPTVVFLLLGGVLSDRHDRRLLMLWSDVVRAAAVACLAILVFADALRLWELVALVAVYGFGTAFFTPAFEAIVPDLLPAKDLAAANSLDQFVRPIALRLVGPLLGGWLVAAGAGVAFTVDAASFAASGVAVLVLRPRALAGAKHASHGAAMREGLAFIRRRVWLWGTLVAAAAAYLVFLGPSEVLLPYMVKNELHGSASDLGLVFAAGGVGAVGAAVWMGQRGHPRRDVTVMYATWTLATLAIAGYGLGRGFVAADGRVPRLQRARDRRDDRLGDGQAAARAEGDARPCLQPRLADLDRSAADLVRPHRARGGRARRARDARRRRPGRRRDHVRSPLPARNARYRGDGRAPGQRGGQARRVRCEIETGEPRPGLHFVSPGAIAQLGERLDRTQEVAGSSPASSIAQTSGF